MAEVMGVEKVASDLLQIIASVKKQRTQVREQDMSAEGQTTHRHSFIERMKQLKARTSAFNFLSLLKDCVEAMDAASLRKVMTLLWQLIEITGDIESPSTHQHVIEGSEMDEWVLQQENQRAHQHLLEENHWNHHRNK